MAASKLFGFLIGGVVEGKRGERKHQRPPWGHPAKPWGDSRARCELSEHVSVSEHKELEELQGLFIYNYIYILFFFPGLVFSCLAVLTVLLHPLLAQAEHCIYSCCWSFPLPERGAESL